MPRREVKRRRRKQKQLLMEPLLSKVIRLKQRKQLLLKRKVQRRL